MPSAAHCSYTSSLVFFATSPLILSAVIMLAFATFIAKRVNPIVPAVLVLLAIAQVAIFVAASLVFSRVDIDVDAKRVTWAFGMGAFRDTSTLDQVGSATADVTVPQGLGLRIMGPHYLAYWLGGKRGVRVTLLDGDEIEVSCAHPESVIDALKR